MAVGRPAPLPDPIAAPSRSLPDPARRYDRGAEARADAHALTRPSLPSLAADLSTEDWDELFNAVKCRLRLTVEAQLAATADPVGPGGIGRALANVLECVDALEQLHALLRLERARRPPV